MSATRLPSYPVHVTMNWAPFSCPQKPSSLCRGGQIQNPTLALGRPLYGPKQAPSLPVPQSSYL